MMKRIHFVDRLQHVALYIFFFSLNFEVWDPLGTDGNLSVAKITGFLYIATLLPQVRAFLRTSGLKPYLRPAWCFFGLLTLISLYHISPSFTQFFNLSIFQTIILFWLLLNHLRKDKFILDKAMLFYSFGTIVLALLYAMDIGIEYKGGRATIFNDNENAMGLRMGFSLMILTATIIQNRLDLGKTRYLLLLPMPLMLLFLVDSGSRVAAISFALAFLIGIYLYRTQKRVRKALLACMLLTICLYGYQHATSAEVLRKRIRLTYTEGYMAQRDKIWESLLPLVQANPFFGVGETGYQKYSVLTFGHEYSPHNVLLEVMCYTGVFGLTLYLILVWRIGWAAYKVYTRDGLLLPFLLMVPIAGMILTGQLLYSKMGWAIFAYVVGAYLFPGGWRFRVDPVASADRSVVGFAPKGLPPQVDHRICPGACQGQPNIDQVWKI